MNFLDIVYFSDTRGPPRGLSRGERFPGLRTGHVEAKHPARDGTSSTQRRRTESEAGRRVGLHPERPGPFALLSPRVQILLRNSGPRPDHHRRASAAALRTQRRLRLEWPPAERPMSFLHLLPMKAPPHQQPINLHASCGLSVPAAQSRRMSHPGATGVVGTAASLQPAQTGGGRARRRGWVSPPRSGRADFGQAAGHRSGR